MIAPPTPMDVAMDRAMLDAAEQEITRLQKQNALLFRAMHANADFYDATNEAGMARLVRNLIADIERIS